MISLRLPPELERKLDTFAKSEGKSRLEIVKESIIEYIKNHGNIKTPLMCIAEREKIEQIISIDKDFSIYKT
ncbi:ribbon-helix-helix protein, CopG family [Leptospira noguchii]|uniref:ribbon-helix-helix protein, CopG family n=1 Tax=Leptospira noguchii TaxID=28182 RepID=UPI001FB6B46A|nr:ribbon-helix-helix protein, CopG family [Leptospira noguchii]UOG37175.1 ribbon-helix-helix protein, CopG family [Leptospira noguchii]